ncbi:MAG: winged helix-turn-helix domain-containing protein [Pseudomonadota bacterium]|uniref:winged helix-turn-helix domain-containing protein n=1 Tax=Rhizorhabdus phycosphaerae TaxID=2711156 RepID=UPI0013EBF6AB|nr:crosslink repair DNA glycosylase YcaQ family protein [Rhizorhabdus phycosphaerae]
MSPQPLSLADARRVVLAAQGFGGRKCKAGPRNLASTLDRLSLHQIDSVNVLSRAHYLPAFSRLGAYDRTWLDQAAWGPRSKRRIFEYWAHEASLLPLDLHPLLRWRMAEADRGERGWGSLRSYAGERRPEAMRTLAGIADEGPLSASDFEDGKGQGGWWGWGEAKRQLEWLFWAGHITTATRRNGFERVYDLTERVIPADILALPTPDKAAAHRALIARAACALGVATETDLRDYFRTEVAPTRDAIAALAEEGVLEPVQVESWAKTAWLYRDARAPKRISAAALLAPFDPLIWERSRTERLFGFHYRIEIYTPAHKRRFGYYVLPFLLGDRLVGRVDLKADRQSSRLLVQSVHHEPGAPAHSGEALTALLREMADWLGLEAVEGRDLPA